MVISARLRKAFTFSIKLIVSAGAIALVVSRIDISQTWATICSARSVYLLLALVVYIASQMLSAMRLNTFFATMPLPLGTLMNMRLYWLGMFYNFFLPGGVGGDGYKVYYLNRHYRRGTKELIAVMFSDRMSGLAAIVIYLLLFASLLVNTQVIALQQWLWCGIPVVLAGYWLFVRIVKRSATGRAWRVMGYSMVIQFVQMSAAGIILYALAGELDNWKHYMLLFYASSIASAIPISMGGIGLREAAFVYGSAWLGTDENVAVALSVLFYVTSLVASLPGLLFVVRPSWIEGRRPHRGTPLYRHSPSDDTTSHI